MGIFVDHLSEDGGLRSTIDPIGPDANIGVGILA
jgi:hypothetical protein